MSSELTDSQNSAPQNVDLSNCDREPIHIPSRIQPHGIMLVVEAETRLVIQASENVEDWLAIPVVELLGQPLERALGAEIAGQLLHDFARAPARNRPIMLRTIRRTVGGVDHAFHAIVHLIDGCYVLELEVAEIAPAGLEAIPDIYAQVDAFTLNAEETQSVAELSQLTATAIRELTDFDRVLIYRFDPEWNGSVIGEDGNGKLPSLLHHYFPASDIPAQARELYRINRLRIIPDANYRPVPLVPASNPVTGRTLDMTFATLRSVSPIHVQYMKNMETASSMSISILLGGGLWGLISCHHSSPKNVSFPVRSTCDLYARAFSLRLTALSGIGAYERRSEMRSVYGMLLEVMTNRGDFAEAISDHPEELLDFAKAQGAVAITEEKCIRIGETPSEAQVRGIVDWLFVNQRQDVYSTDCLSDHYPPAKQFLDVASGILAVAVSKIHPSYVIWFRPEVIQTIQWGGDPRKSVDYTAGEWKIHPRQSFETWKQIVHRKSTAWTPTEIEGATELRNAIVGVVLKKAEEIADLTTELTRSNRELEAFSYSVSHDLRAPLRHIVGYAEMLRESCEGKLSPRDERCINTIIESSEYAGKLVEKLLEYSRLGRAELQLNSIDMNALVREMRADVMRDANGRKIEWTVAQLPTVQADLMMLRMAVRDLLSNAVKYSRERDVARIEVGHRSDPDQEVFWVKDNGVGFDMQYADKLFGVFQRLHRWEDYEGTGIGLANVRRVMERHNGHAWADSIEGQGSTFYISLPRIGKGSV